MITVITCFIIFTLIGFGPSLYIIGARRYDVLLISPVIGFGILAIVIVNLIYTFDIALAGFGIILLIILIFISGGLAVLYYIKHARQLRRIIFSRPLLFLFIGIIIMAFLVSLPAMIGGGSYRIWQGNMYDWINYNLIAFLRLNFNTVSYSNPAQFQDIASIFSDLYIFGRMGVAFILGWLADLYQMPVYEVTYDYVLAIILTLFPMGIALGRLLRLRLSLSILLGMVLTIGFWTYLVADINALSQVGSIPFILFFVYAWIQFEKQSSSRLFSRQRLVMALSITLIFVIYPELLPLLALSMGIYYALRWVNHPQKHLIGQALSHIITVGISLLLVAPTVAHTVTYLVSQISVGSSDTLLENWHIAHFSWMYRNNDIVTNLLGLHPYSSAVELTESRFLLLISTLVMLLIAIAILTILLNGIAKSVSNPQKRAHATILSSAIISYWGVGLMMQFMNLQWTGAKFIAMGAPFVTIALFLFYQDFSRQSRPIQINNGNISRFISIGITTFFGIWVISQIAIPLIRIFYITQDKAIIDYSPLNYVEYDRVSPINDYLQEHPNSVVYSTLSNQRLPGDLLWNWMFSMNSHDHVGFNGVYYHHSYKVAKDMNRWEKSDNLPDYWVSHESVDVFYQSGIGSLILDMTDFRLYQLSASDMDALNFIISPLELNHLHQSVTTGMEPLFIADDGIIQRWLRDEARIRFMASGTMPYVIYLKGTASYDGGLDLILDDTQTTIAQLPVSPDTLLEYASCFTPTPATNNMTFLVDGQPDKLEESFLLQTMWILPTSNRLDIGNRLTDSRFIMAGWESDEQWGEENVRWANETAQFMLFVCDDAPTTLRFRAFYSPDLNPNPQQVTVSVNGVEHPPVTLAEGWHEYELPLLDGAFLPNQPQIITLQHAWATIPAGDSRALSATYDWFEMITIIPN